MIFPNIVDLDANVHQKEAQDGYPLGWGGEVAEISRFGGETRSPLPRTEWSRVGGVASSGVKVTKPFDSFESFASYLKHVSAH